MSPPLLHPWDSDIPEVLRVSEASRLIHKSVVAVLASYTVKASVLGLQREATPHGEARGFVVAGLGKATAAALEHGTGDNHRSLVWPAFTGSGVLGVRE